MRSSSATSLTCLFTLVSTLAIALPPRAPSNLSTTLPLVNTTSLDLDVDSRFGFRALYGETNIPVTPCFLNVVELMAQYAELDWLSQVRRRQGVVLPAYPEVEIAVLPAAPATTMEVRLVVWAIWAAIRDIVQSNSFHEAEFEISWEGSLAAYIYITKPMDSQFDSGNETVGTGKSLTLLPNANGTISDISDTSQNAENSLPALNAERFNWRPYFTPVAETLTPVQVFLTVMAGLKNAAPHPALDKIQGPYASAAMDVFANVQFFLHKRRSPRTSPPYFQYIHVIKALRLVPGYMLQSKRFAELVFLIEVNGIPVGEGYLEKGHYRPPLSVFGDIVQSTDNVSLS